MKYKSKYYSVEAVVFTGKNFKEINDFTGNIVAWQSKEKDWNNDNPPEDLKVILLGDFPQHIKKGNYVIKLSNEHYITLDECSFEGLFDKIEE